MFINSNVHVFDAIFKGTAGSGGSDTESADETSQAPSSRGDWLKVKDAFAQHGDHDDSRGSTRSAALPLSGSPDTLRPTPIKIEVQVTPSSS